MKFLSNTKARVLAVIAGVAFIAAPALAGGGGGGTFTPLNMEAIEFPIVPASIVAVVVAAGAGLLLLSGGWRVAFSMIRRFIGKLGRSAG
ncbi:MAG TPA: hypothetical protein VHN77_13365 [Phycisphaerales bacterium]|nr:hypothetical protein [Phycisphaerales bacterium]